MLLFIIVSLFSACKAWILLNVLFHSLQLHKKYGWKSVGNIELELVSERGEPQVRHKSWLKDDTLMRTTKHSHLSIVQGLLHIPLRHTNFFYPDLKSIIFDFFSCQHLIFLVSLAFQWSLSPLIFSFGWNGNHQTGGGGDGRTLTRYKASNIENEYSGTELAV